MKLLDILARELEIWPEGMKVLTQSAVDTEIYGGDNADDASSLRPEFYASHRHTEDTHYPGVTREQWAEARAKLQENPKVKANKDGWIRHRGGKCPVADGELVDVRFRSGEVETDHDYPRWEHLGNPRDIMFWRPHNPDWHKAAIEEGIRSAEAGELTPAEGVKAKWQGRDPRDVASDPDGTLIVSSSESLHAFRPNPLAWRDRIHSIDAEQEAEETAHKSATAQRRAERASLVAKLAAEGLALVEPVNAQDAAQEVDIGDWDKWQAGDMLECASTGSGCYTLGRLYAFIKMSEWGSARTIDDVGGENGLPPSFFKWHSRP